MLSFTLFFVLMKTRLLLRIWSAWWLRLWRSLEFTICYRNCSWRRWYNWAMAMGMSGWGIVVVMWRWRWWIAWTADDCIEKTMITAILENFLRQELLKVFIGCLTPMFYVYVVRKQSIMSGFIFYELIALDG